MHWQSGVEVEPCFGIIYGLVGRNMNKYSLIYSLLQLTPKLDSCGRLLYQRNLREDKIKHFTELLAIIQGGVVHGDGHDTIYRGLLKMKFLLNLFSTIWQREGAVQLFMSTHGGLKLGY